MLLGLCVLNRKPTMIDYNLVVVTHLVLAMSYCWEQEWQAIVPLLREVLERTAACLLATSKTKSSTRVCRSTGRGIEERHGTGASAGSSALVDVHVHQLSLSHCGSLS